jgi:hypothetical protein
MAITRLSVDGYGARRAGSFAGRVEVVVVPVVTQEQLGGKPEKKKKRRKSLYDDIEPRDDRRTEITTPVVESVTVEHEPVHDTIPVSGEPQPGLSVMSDAFAKAGIRTPEQIISEQEAIDKRKKFNLAAIILLLD